MASFDNKVKTSDGWKDVADVKVKTTDGWKTVEDILVKATDGWHSIKNGAPVDSGVYTISWTESSTPKNITWDDDAAEMTETQRLAKIKEHSHFAVVRYDSTEQKPVVNYWLYDESLIYRATDETGKTSSGVASNLTGTDGDVFLMYEPVWWKVTSEGSGTSKQITISFTWDQSKTDSTWVSPHTYGDSLDDTSLAKYVGMGVFLGYRENNKVLRSINISSAAYRTEYKYMYQSATYGRNWQYNGILPMTWAWYIICLYFVKGNRNCQTAYGNGYTNTTTTQNVNINWYASNAWNRGTTSNMTTGVTALGIHNPWGGVSSQIISEMCNDGGIAKFSVLGGKDHYDINEGTASTWKTASMKTDSINYVTTQINSDCQEYPFLPLGGSSADYASNYADTARGSSSQLMMYTVGGGNKSEAGPLFVDASNGASTYSYSRLHVIITE